MNMNMNLQIVGVKPSKFSIDDYKEDTTKVYALVDLNPDDGAFGKAVEVFNYKTSEDVQKFKDMKFPFDADCKVELLSSGKKSKLVLHDVVLPKQSQITQK